MTLKPVLLGVLGLLLSGGASASLITVSSYSMINGTYNPPLNFEDTGYGPCTAPCVAGNQTVAYAPLNGGKGKLTDGIASTLDYNAQGTDPATTYVGWYPATDQFGNGLNPIVTFNFASSQTVQTVGIHVDNFPSGEVALPASVTIHGNQTFTVTSDATTGPRWIYFTSLGDTGTSLTVQFNQAVQSNSDGVTCCWVMVDEVTFDDGGTGGQSTAPEPASWSLLAGGLALVAFARKRKR